jgi:hypothetical protein
VVLICVSFMASSGEHFFHVFFSHLDFFLWKVLFNSVAHFFIGSPILGGRRCFKQVKMSFFKNIVQEVKTGPI